MDGHLKCVRNLCSYDSIFIRMNKEALVTDLKIVHDNWMAKNPDLINMTYDYGNYNIFNLCMFSKPIMQLQNIIHKYIFIYLDEFEIKHDGFVIQAWLNYHNKENQLLKSHTHDPPYHGYVSIQPGESETIFSDWNGRDLHIIKNRVGLIYLNVSNQYTFHRVEVKNPSDLINQPRITLAFDFFPIPFRDSISRTSVNNSSFYTVFK